LLKLFVTMAPKANSQALSASALGKRKASAIETAIGEESVATQPVPLQRTRTRVLPTRSRRVGGPGIGSVEVDELILDSQKRKRV
jgi:hypothetical protein